MKALPGALYVGALRGAAAEGHRKARAMLSVRRQQVLPEGPFDLWIHAASLGEYLMAKPLLTLAEQEGLKVLLSFFSTSGAEIAQKEHAHFAFAPLDRPKAVRSFLARTQPKQVLFMKYDLWPMMTSELRRVGIPYSVAFAEVKPRASRLWAWNPLERPMWTGAAHVFHQTSESLERWTRAGYANGQLSGDGRFDQVGQRPAPAGVETFTDFRPVLVLGSSWKPEEDLLLPLLLRFPELKVILAPHAISRTAEIAERLPVPAIRWSEFEQLSLTVKEEARVLLVDTLGDLAALYACGDLALVGGAFGPGLHNILEALAHGLPVACGPNVEGHWEAQHPEAPVTLLPKNAQPADLAAWLKERLEKPALLQSEKEKALAFIAQHRGASQRVWEVLKLA
jgi:3-deoxy-D-manno-octulosonic-acid transferase